MEKLFFSHNDKIELQQIPYFDQIKIPYVLDPDQKNKKSSQGFDPKFHQILRKIISQVGFKEENNKKVCQLIINLMVKLESFIELNYDPKLYVILNRALEQNSNLSLQRKRIDFAFLTKIRKGSSENHFSDFSYSLAALIFKKFIEEKSQRLDMSNTATLILTLNTEKQNENDIYIGLGFINTKLEIITILDKLRVANYTRNKISSNLIPRMSKTNMHKIMSHYITLIRSLLFENDINPNEKNLKDFIQLNFEQIHPIIKELNQSALEEIFIRSNPNTRVKAYLIDLSKIIYDHHEIVSLTIINTLFYTFDIIWKKTDHGSSYICELIDNILIFVCTFSEIIGTVDYSDQDGLNKLSSRARIAIELMESETNSSIIASENRDSVKKDVKKQYNNGVFFYYQNYIKRTESKVQKVIENSISVAKQWTEPQRLEKAAESKLNFNYISPKDIKPKIIKLNTYHVEPPNVDNSMELERFFKSKGILRRRLPDRIELNKIKSEIQENLIKINYYYLPLLYSYYISIERRALSLDRMYLADFNNFDVEFILRKVIEFFIYEENSLIKVSETFLSSPKLLQEFWDVFSFYLTNPYNSNPTILKSKFVEIMEHYAAASFSSFCKAENFNDDSSQILLHFLKSILYRDENDDFMESLNLNLKNLISEEESHSISQDKLGVLKQRAYNQLFHKDIMNLLPTFLSETMLELSEFLFRQAKADSLDKVFVYKYVCAFYLSILLTAVSEGWNPNYCSNTNKYQSLLPEKVLNLITEFLYFPKFYLDKQSLDFEEKLEMFKQKHNSNNQYKQKKDTSNMFLNVLLPGVSLQFLLNIMKFVANTESNSNQKIHQIIKMMLIQDPKLFDKFKNLDNSLAIIMININNTKKEAYMESDSHENSNIVLDQELSHRIRDYLNIPLNNFMENYRILKRDSKSSKPQIFSKIKNDAFDLLERKKELIENFIINEDSFYDKIKDSIPLYNRYMDYFQIKEKSDHQYLNKDFKISKFEVEEFYKIADDIIKYDKIFQKLEEYKTNIIESIRILEMKKDLVENFSDVAVLIRKDS